MKKHTRRELESTIKKFGPLYRALSLSERARLADSVHLSDNKRAAGLLFASRANYEDRPLPNKRSSNGGK